MPFKKPHPLYSVYHSMKERCRNKNFKQWERYGGRGIKVCDRWLEPVVGFHNFLSDMGDRPHGHTLDRINNDGDYSPDNCRWASRKSQQRNQSVTRKVVIDGVEYLAVELAEKYNLKTDTIVERSSIGLSFNAVVSRKKRVYKKGLALGGIANGARQKSKTHCVKGHPYNDENTIITQQGWRRCKTCHRDKEAERRAIRRKSQ